MLGINSATWQSILLSPPCDLPGIGCWRCNISETEALKIKHGKSGLGQGLIHVRSQCRLKIVAV